MPARSCICGAPRWRIRWSAGNVSRRATRWSSGTSPPIATRGVSRRRPFPGHPQGRAACRFRSGQHVCVGSRLAEMQLRVAFDLLADRVTSFERASTAATVPVEFHQRPQEPRRHHAGCMRRDARGRAFVQQREDHRQDARTSTGSQRQWGRGSLPAGASSSAVMNCPRSSIPSSSSTSVASPTPVLGSRPVEPLALHSGMCHDRTRRCCTGWRIDGELDVVTVSVPMDQLQDQRAVARFREMRFAFADPLGIALTRQILSELYAAQTVERTAYIGTLLDALKMHTLRSSPPSSEGRSPAPTSPPIASTRS